MTKTDDKDTDSSALREELERSRARMTSWRRASTDNGIRFNRMEAALASTQERLSEAYAEQGDLKAEGERLHEELKRVAAYKIALDTVPVKIHGVPCDKCGGTDYQCAECLENIAEIGSAASKIEYERQAEVRQLREQLERLRGDDGHPHESGDECIGCERSATERSWPYCNQCLLEGQLEFCNGTATEAITRVGQLHEELAQAAAREIALVEAANTKETQMTEQRSRPPTQADVGEILTLRNDRGARYHGLLKALTSNGAVLILCYGTNYGTNWRTLRKPEHATVTGAEVLDDA